MNKLFLLPLVSSFCVTSIAQGQVPPKETEKVNPAPRQTATMAKAEVLSLLAEDKHVADQQKIVDRESAALLFTNRKIPMIPKSPQEQKEVAAIHQQLVAIESAGELKDKDFVPYLMNYVDYVAPGTMLVGSIRTSVLIETRMKRHPAVKALMKINSSSAMVAYIESDRPFDKRAGALSVLREIDCEKSVVIGTQLLESPEAKNDVRRSSWIQWIMQKGPLQPKLTLVKITPVK